MFPSFDYRSICIKDQFAECLPQLMQLEEGLSTCQVLQSIQKFPNVWKVVFLESEEFKMTADKLLDEAVVEYNTSQLLKDKEITTFKLFSDVMMLLDDGELLLSLVYIFNCQLPKTCKTSQTSIIVFTQALKYIGVL